MKKINSLSVVGTLFSKNGKYFRIITKPVILGSMITFFLISILGSWLPSQAYGLPYIPIGVDTAMFFVIISWIVSFFLLLLIFSKKLRWVSIASFFFLISSMIAFSPALHLGNSLRMYEFTNLAKRSEPLIDAINSYKTTEGILPSKLEDLVPKYLKEFPTTKMAEYSQYSYSKSKENKGEWSLYVPCGQGVLNWDQFIYHSNQDYSRIGDSITKTGDWVYYHE